MEFAAGIFELYVDDGNSSLPIMQSAHRAVQCMQGIAAAKAKQNKYKTNIKLIQNKYKTNTKQIQVQNMSIFQYFVNMCSNSEPVLCSQHRPESETAGFTPGLTVAT